MSTQSDLAMMQQLVDMKYRQQQESFGRLIMQENALRASLAKLDTHLADSRNNTDASHKAIGADVVWQAWVGRNKRELNMQLAQVLAIKERHITQVKQAYGKVLATQELHAEVRKQEAKKTAQSQLDRAISSMLF
ncbi:MAG: hypothetical protein ABJN72_14465 [Sulfitobacter sp.]